MTATVAPPSRTYHSIDLLKVVAALLVVAIHARPFEGDTYPLFISLFSRMAVPVFFVVSAFFFFRKNPTSTALKHYLKRMGLLYAFWFVVEAYFTIDAAFFAHDWSTGKALAIFLRNAVLNSTFSGSWFIMALMIGIPVVHWLGRRISSWAIFAIGLALYVPIVATTNYYNYLPTSAQSITDSALKALGYYHNSFLAALVFCAMGKLIAEHEQTIAEWKGWTSTALVLLCAGGAALEVAGHNARFDDCYFMLVPTTAAIVIWVLQHEVNWNLPYQYLRNFSTITYFSHFIFVWFLTGKGFFTPIATYFVIVALCIITTLILRRLARHIPFLTYAY